MTGGTNLKNWVVISVFVLGMGCTAAAGRTIYVDNYGTGDFNTIQAAIDDSIDGDTIIVQEGIYRGVGNRNIDFLGKAIIVKGTDPNDSAVVDNTVVDCQGISGALRRGFYFHRGETRSSVISGLTITNGYADGSWPSNNGGAIYCYRSSPTIELCRIVSNRAEHHGGGIYCTNSSPEIKDCQISFNTVDSWDGGGVYCIKGNPTISDSDINNNSAVQGGGGLYCRENNVSVHRCHIFNNHSTRGGGIYTFRCNDPTFHNCLITNNTSSRGAPAIYMFEGYPKIDHCTIAKNEGYPYFGSVYCNNQEYGMATITNCVVWDNAGWHQMVGGMNVSFCDVGRAGCSGEGNINVNPIFVDPESGDFDLLPLSPCINAGDPCYLEVPHDTDIVGRPRVLNNRVDMGAYERALEAPFLGVLPIRLDFVTLYTGPNPDAQKLHIRNDGPGSLSWQITEDCDWLELSRMNGESSGEVNEVVISANISELEGGVHTCDLIIEANEATNSPMTIRATLEILTPLIDLSTNAFDFTAKIDGVNPEIQTLTIRNSGVLALDWAIDYDCNWLSVYPTEGISNGETNEVTLSVDISGLDAGVYQCELMVSDANALNNPQTVIVTLDVLGPLIVLSEKTIDFKFYQGELDPNSYNLQIANGGGGILQWNLNFDCNWIDASDLHGELAADETTDVILMVDANSLSIGEHVCNMTVSDVNSDNSPQSVEVLLYVNCIQFDIDAAFDGDTVIVEPGIYRGKYNRDLDLQGKSIIVTSIDPNDPCVVAATIIDCNGSAAQQHRAFYFHSGEDSNSSIMGFTIINGYEHDGAGVYCDNASPVIYRCRFLNNTAEISGGAMYCYQSGASIIGCQFAGNLAARGGALYTYSDSYNTVLIDDCEMSGNFAWEGGGVAVEWMSKAEILNCNITENHTELEGGGIWLTEGDVIMKNCLVAANTSNHCGGVFQIYGTSVVSNCTIADNYTNYGDDIILLNGNMTVKNSIIWDEIFMEGADASFSFCNIKNCGNSGPGWDVFRFGNDAGGNIDIDPCFADPFNNDYHLQSAAGRWDPNCQIWVMDVNTSECIDNGDPNSDWTAELWPHGTRINMGAYGGTPEASMSLSDTGNIADLIPDSCVAYSDMILFTDKWLHEEVLLAEDLDRSGFVNFFDFAIFAGNWGPPPPTRASNPSPPDRLIVINLDFDLSWTAGLGATSHDVYFGTTSPPPFVCNQLDTIFDPATVISGTKYYWRIDEVNKWSKTPGQIWSFTTFGPPPPPP